MSGEAVVVFQRVVSWISNVAQSDAVLSDWMAVLNRERGIKYI